MPIKYYVSVYSKDSERDCETGYDLVTTRKAEYKKFAKQALKDGAESVGWKPDAQTSVPDKSSFPW